MQYHTLTLSPEGTITVTLTSHLTFPYLHHLSTRLETALQQAAPQSVYVLFDSSRVQQFPTQLRQFQRAFQFIREPNLAGILDWGNYDPRWSFLHSILYQMAGIPYQAYASQQDATAARCRV
jgi:hypothetical protein